MFAHPKREASLENREYNGYFYSIDSRNNDTIYLHCKEKRLQSCRATATLIGGHFTLTRNHNHAANPSLGIVHDFTNRLYEAVTSSLRSPRVIYDEVSLMDSTAASNVPFVQTRISMNRWRGKNSPPVPHSWTMYAEILNQERWEYLRTYNGGELSVASVQGTDGSTSVVFGDREFLRSIDGTNIAVDATFKILPRRPKVLQFLTIMMRIDDVMLPIAWAVMERKTTAAYVAVLGHFATTLAPHLRPSSYMLDFERALATALRRTYPDAAEEHCYFHHCQALMKAVKRLGLRRLMNGCDARKIVFRMLMALALLPANDIPAAFEWLIHATPRVIARDFRRLFEYYETYWIHNVGPNVVSVFGLEHKTNNDIESYHRVLRVRFGVHPTVWLFTERLRNLQSVIRSSFQSLDLGLAITRTSETPRISQRAIQRAWQLYENGLLDIPRFLACASHCLRAFNEHLLFNEGQVQDFANEAVGPDVHGHRAIYEENVEEAWIFRRELPEGELEILLLPELVFPACVLCDNNRMDTISLPCCHWIACAACTRYIMQLSVAEDARILCGVCGELATGFHTIIIRNE